MLQQLLIKLYIILSISTPPILESVQIKTLDLNIPIFINQSEIPVNLIIHCYTLRQKLDSHYFTKSIPNKDTYLIITSEKDAFDKQIIRPDEKGDVKLQLKQGRYLFILQHQAIFSGFHPGQTIVGDAVQTIKILDINSNNNNETIKIGVILGD